MELLWILLFFSILPQNISDCQESKKCATTRIRGLKTSDCYHKDLRKFPKCLPSKVEVIDLSYNRIRSISKDDLENYLYITHLYLSDNLLTKLERDTFSPLQNLQILDLSINDLSTSSISEVFQIPTLRALYLSQNINSNIAESIENVKLTSQSSLTKLDISYITKEGSSVIFPDFAEFPMVAFLNITGNQFGLVSTKHFAALCNLQILANVNTSTFKNDCDCSNINQWLAARRVKFTPFECPIRTEECSEQSFPQEYIDAYEKCKKKVDKIKQNKNLGEIGLWIGVSLIIILVLAAFYGYYYWSKHMRQKPGI